MTLRAVVTLWALAATATPDVGAPQSLGVAAGRDLPAWMEEWSPLAPRADLPRLLPGTSTALPLLLLPTPRVGLFWLAGNPAALASEVADERTDFILAGSGQDGEYRRPLDSERAALVQLSGLSWRPVSAGGAAIGRVVLDQETFDPGSLADVTQPYSSSPFVVADTSRGATRRTRARLVGAAGSRLGRWALGGALGYETRDHSTVRAGFARFARQVAPAATVGMTRRLGDRGMEVGIHARWREEAETVQLFEGAQEGLVYQLEGYRDVAAQDVRGSYYRRIEKDVASAGAGASGGWGSGRWVLFVEGARLRETLWRQLQDHPARDRWETSSWSVAGAAQRPLAGGRWLLTVQGRRISLSGDGDVALDSAGVIFRAHERGLFWSAELRLLPRGSSGWTAVATLSVVNERRDRVDSAAGLRTEIETLTPGIALEAGRMVAGHLFVSSGFSRATYMPRGEIPQPAARGKVYRELIAPEIELYSTDATSQAFSIAARWQARRAMAFWMAARSESLAPARRQRPSGFRPQGGRTAQYVAFGVTLAGTR